VATLARRSRCTDQANFGGTFEFGDLEHFALQHSYVYRINRGSPNVSFSMYEVSGFFQSDLKLGCPPDRSFGQILVEDAGSNA